MTNRWVVLNLFGLLGACTQASGNSSEVRLPELPPPPGPAPLARDPDTSPGCEAPPAGMVCIPGGTAVIGDELRPEERPRHQVEISTFYLDQHEVTNSRYETCVEAGVCPRRPRPTAVERPFLADELPATMITWEMAHRFCVWAGKRLPTEAEWEKAARHGNEGRTYPWGEAEPDCDRAMFAGCGAAIARPVGSFPPTAFGVHDLAGNGYEWVADWATPCYQGCRNACGQACLGRDPRGPCDGAPRCPGRHERLLKGGSWYWPATELRGAARRARKPNTGRAHLGFRCASSEPVLTSWPPLALTDPLPLPALPTPPTAAELAIFNAVPEDPDVLKIEPCYRKGLATLDCRDPMTYIKSNEKLQRVWRPYIENLGGAYVGLGADQSYSFIAAAKSRWAWIFDYDPQVVRLHQLLHRLLDQHESRTTFVEAFAPKNRQATRAWLRGTVADQPAVRRALDETFRNFAGRLYSHYLNEARDKPLAQGFGWLRNDANYAYVRTLLRQGRVRVVTGNMLNATTLPSIAASARQLDVPVRIYYPSNAEEAWLLTPQYRANVAGLPFDQRSVILRTQIGRRFRDDDTESYWHYIVHGAPDAQRRIGWAGITNVTFFMHDRLPTNLEMLSVIRLPARTITEPAALSAQIAP